jgi:hypothetical protein
VKSDEDDEARPEYPPEPIRSGERGRHTRRYRKGSNVLVTDPDPSAAFPHTELVPGRRGPGDP